MLQRDDPKAPSVLARGFAVALGVTLGLSALSCASGPQATPNEDPQGPSAMLVIESQPGDPHVIIDDTLKGTVSRWRDRTIPVPPGAHRLELRHDGYHPYRADVELKPGRMYNLRVFMVRAHDP